jgi:Multiubiquitin
MTPSAKRITILVNNQEVEVPKGELTGLEIKQAAGVPDDFTLYRRQGSHLNEIPDGQEIKVHEREEFVAVSGQDVS